jgi:signal transduction histidine kinase
MSHDPSTSPQFLAAVERAKLSALYNLAYGLSHEFNNPLANISSRAQALLADEKDPERRKKLAAIVAQSFRAHEMIADLMLFAKPPLFEKQPIDLMSIAKRAVELLQPSAAEQKTELVVEPCADLPAVQGDPVALAEAIKAVLTNGLEALGEGGRVRLACSADERQVALTIADSGPGIPADVRPHIFDPYYSGREAGRGLGLGLSKCWRILDAHGGRVEVDSDGRSGATFRLCLPRAE